MKAVIQRVSRASVTVDGEIISSIAQLASTLDLTVIAEFVETEEERDTLHEIGCDCYHGYLYSPAVYL